MTVAPPQCTCDFALAPPGLQRCPIHGSKHTKQELDTYREAAERSAERIKVLEAELRLYRKADAILWECEGCGWLCAVKMPGYAGSRVGPHRLNHWSGQVACGPLKGIALLSSGDPLYPT